ncbi:hypothetical protein D1872_274940 [compost metagenome]
MIIIQNIQCVSWFVDTCVICSEYDRNLSLGFIEPKIFRYKAFAILKLQIVQFKYLLIELYGFKVTVAHTINIVGRLGNACFVKCIEMGVTLEISDFNRLPDWIVILPITIIS